MKKILSFGLGLILIANFLSAQTNFVSVTSGNWDNNTTWGTAAGVYPGSAAAGVTGSVTISAGDAVTLNVTPANPIGSLTIEGGGGTTSLTLSATYMLTVTGGILIDAATGAAATKSIVVNGAAQLNAGSLTINASNNINKPAFLQINGGVVNITGNVTMAATTPEHQRTLITFPGGGTLTIGGTLTLVQSQ
jgi:hypothetical protein